MGAGEGWIGCGRWRHGDLKAKHIKFLIKQCALEWWEPEVLGCVMCFSSPRSINRQCLLRQPGRVRQSYLQKTSILSIQDLPTFPIHFHWNRMIKFLWDTLIIIPNHDLSTSYNILQCQCPSPGLGLNFTVHLTIGWYYFHFIFQSGKTALHFAAHKGQLLAVKALIEAGADLDIKDEVRGSFK